MCLPCCLYSICYVRILVNLSSLLLLFYLFDGFVSVYLCRVHYVHIASCYVIIIYLIPTNDLCSCSFCLLLSCERLLGHLHLRSNILISWNLLSYLKFEVLIIFIHIHTTSMMLLSISTPHNSTYTRSTK